jgi:hypothetical protein
MNKQVNLMSSHRALVSLIAAFSFCSAVPGSIAYAATTNYLYVAHTTASLVQNSGAETVTVYRNGSTSGAVSVLCQTANGTAVSGRDFTAVSTTLHWASGSSTPQVCSVPISDGTPFSGPRTFTVALSDPSGIALSSNDKVTVTVFGNKGGGTVSVAAPTYTVAQSAGQVTISVNRTGGSAGPADVSYATANKTAIAGTDYTSKQGQLSWANGDTAPKTFSIPVSNAKPFSGTKTLAIAIAGGINVVLGSSTSAIVTINGDAATAASGTATLSWAAPTANTEGEPLPLSSLKGYHIFYGTSASALTKSVAVSGAATTSTEISGLASGTWFFAVAADATDGTEGARSAVASASI